MYFSHPLLGSRGPARGFHSPGDGKGTREQDETGKAAGGLDSTHPSFYWPRKVPQSNRVWRWESTLTKSYHR